MRKPRLIELTEQELCKVRGGDLCIVGYEAVDDDGDGIIDYIQPIYGECSSFAPGPTGELTPG
jgi:hypothetical protein